MATLMLEGILLVLRLSRSENILKRRRNIATTTPGTTDISTSIRGDSDLLPISSIPPLLTPLTTSTSPITQLPLDSHNILDDGLRLRATIKR